MAGIKVWSTAQSIIALSRVFDSRYELYQLKEAIDGISVIPSDETALARRIVEIIHMEASPSEARSASIALSISIIIIGILAFLFLFREVGLHWNQLEGILWLLTSLVSIILLLIGVNVSEIRDRILNFIYRTVRNRKILTEIENHTTRYLEEQ